MNGGEISQTEQIPVLIVKSQVKQGTELLARVFQDALAMKIFLGDDSKMLDKAAILIYQAIV